MTHAEQITAFQNDLGKLIDRYTAEYDLPLASVVGTMHIVMLDLVANQKATPVEECGHDWVIVGIPDTLKCRKYGIERPA